MKVIFIKSKFILVLLIILFVFFAFFVRHIFCYAKEGKQKSSSNTLNSIFDSPAKIAYLTFDDGPSEKVTPKILDILKEENVKATFFVVGKHVKEHPELVKRAYEEGHFIANHGYTHNNKLLYKSADNFIKEILNTDEEIGKAIGVENYSSHIFRFPNGFCTSLFKSQKKKVVQSLANIDYVYIDWNCLNKDSEKKYSPKQLIENLKKSSKNKGTLVVLMHDTGDVNNTYDVLKDSIEYLKSQGYEFRNFCNWKRNALKHIPFCFYFFFISIAPIPPSIFNGMFPSPYVSPSDISLPSSVIEPIPLLTFIV